GALAFGSAVPLFSFISTLGLVGRAASGVLLAAWTIYWAGVFTAAKTAYGWTNANSAPDPVYVRTIDGVSRRFPSVIRWFPAMLTKILRFFTRSLFAPASRFEASPYELTGLGLARWIRCIPGVYLVVRPLFGVAAAHLILVQEQRVEQRRAA